MKYVKFNTVYLRRKWFRIWDLFFLLSVQCMMMLWILSVLAPSLLAAPLLLPPELPLTTQSPSLFVSLKNTHYTVMVKLHAHTHTRIHQREDSRCFAKRVCSLVNTSATSCHLCPHSLFFWLLKATHLYSRGWHSCRAKLTPIPRPTTPLNSPCTNHVVTDLILILESL